MVRKRRTREHVIADLSANHVERMVLLCNFSVERITHDYGIDLAIITYAESGEVENGQISIQLKATDHLTALEDRDAVTFAVQRADLELWLHEPMPCILVVYDAQADVAYWLYLQAYFAQLEGFRLAQMGESVTVYLPRNNVLNPEAIRQFARYRDSVLAQIERVVRHGEH